MSPHHVIFAEIGSCIPIGGRHPIEYPPTVKLYIHRVCWGGGLPVAAAWVLIPAWPHPHLLDKLCFRCITLDRPNLDLVQSAIHPIVRPAQ